MAVLRLIILRHAEAEPQAAGSDHARRLTKKGMAEAHATAAKLVALDLRPTHVVTSDARRALETTEGVLEGMGGIAYTKNAKLYLSGLEAIADLLSNINATTHSTVMIVGHNPGFSEAASRLAGRPVSLGTAHAAVMTIEAVTWTDGLAAETEWKLEMVAKP